MFFLLSFFFVFLSVLFVDAFFLPGMDRVALERKMSMRAHRDELIQKGILLPDMANATSPTNASTTLSTIPGESKKIRSFAPPFPSTGFWSYVFFFFLAIFSFSSFIVDANYLSQLRKEGNLGNKKPSSFSFSFFFVCARVCSSGGSRAPQTESNGSV